MRILSRVVPKILIPERYRKDPRYTEEFAIPVILAVSLRLSVLLLVPSLVAIGLSAWESDRRSDSNLVLIERLETTEARLETEQEENRRAIADADKVLCRGINAERKIMANLIRSVIAARETESARRQQAHFFAVALVKLEPRNCDKLPSSG